MIITYSCDPPRPQEGGTVIPTPNLEFNKGLLSPVIIVPPLLNCGTSVQVKGYVPGAKISIYSGTTLIAQKIGLDPDGEIFAVSPDLSTGNIITATQEFDGATSGPSIPETVKKHTDVYPNGLPKPEFPFLYLYNCGIATAVNHLPPGGQLRVYSRENFAGSPKTLVGSVTGVGEGQSVGINPAFIEGRLISAESQICTDVSPASDEQLVKAAPTSLPQTVVTGLYENGVFITVNNLVNGAKVTLKKAGSVIGGGGAPGPHVKFHLSSPVASGDQVEIVQELCGVFSPPEIVTVQPCSSLPPARIEAPRAGDESVHVIEYVEGSRIWIFASNQEIGDGGGGTIQLTRPLVDGETIIVVQALGNCTSSTSFTLVVGHGLDDPGTAGRCGKTQKFEYGQSNDPAKQTTDVSSFFNSPDISVSVPMNAVPLHGVVRYPSGPGPFPIILIVHGNHNPGEKSYPGYDYLLDQLASHCMIVVSIEEDFLNGNVGGEMDARGIVLLRHLQLWREWNRTPGNEFFGKVDLGNVGLAGHSRGGEAIVAAKLFNQTLHNHNDPAFDFNFGIRSLYALAPVDGQFDNGPITLSGADYYVMHGSHDGDVSDFGGHMMYDRAFPVTNTTSNFKGLLWVYGANHAQWNSVWSPSGDPYKINPKPQLISEANQMAIGKTYMSAFYLAGLKGWNSYKFFLNGQVTFSSLPSTVTRVFQYQDPNRIFVNHYEEDNDLATGSFSGVTNSQQGNFSIYSDYRFSDNGSPHFLWGQTDGLIAGWDNTENAEVHMKIPSELAVNLSSLKYLAFRVGQTHEAVQKLNAPGTNKDMTVQVVVGGVAGPQVKVSSYQPLPYPMVTDAPPWGGGPKTILQTIRIPWTDLFGKPNITDPKALTEVIFKFNRHTTGILAIDEVQFTK